MCKKPWFLLCRTHFAEVFPIQKAIRNERKKRTKIILEKGAPPAMENMKIRPRIHNPKSIKNDDQIKEKNDVATTMRKREVRAANRTTK